MKKPKMLKDWDENRRIVITPSGTKLVLFKKRADEVYEAGLKVWEKHKLEKKLKKMAGF
jgi:hypothetical protein